MGLIVDPTFRAGDIITLLGFAIGGLGFAWTMRGDLKMLARDVKAQGQKIDKLEAIITVQAVQDQRISDLDRRIEEMRHGRGFIQSEIDGLYGRGGRISNG